MHEAHRLMIISLRTLARYTLLQLQPHFPGIRIRIRFRYSMARSAIGTRSVTGRAAAAKAELARKQATITTDTSKLTGSRSKRTGKRKNVAPEESESELSSLPSDLSDEEGVVRDVTTSSRHFTSKTAGEDLKTALGKRRRAVATDGGVGGSETVDRELGELGKKVERGIKPLVYGKSSETALSSTDARGSFSSIRKELEGSSTGISSSRRGTRQIPKTEPQVDKVKQEVESLVINEGGGEIVEGKGKKPSRVTNNKRIKPSTPVPLPAPPHWEEMYSLVRKMRSLIPAPVDTMGCERLAQPVGGPITPAISRFQTLVSLLLSSQTKDTVTAVAVWKMQTLLPDGLTIPSILATTPEVLDSLITPVGFHNKKTQYLIQTAQILKEKYNSDIPHSIEDLCTLPGVGPKMAYLCMSAAWNETQGIGVDVHVHRIANMWGWTGGKGTETPEQTRVALESWLPGDRWREINHMLVGFGQTICLSRAPKCGECLLAERGLCRAARVPPKRVGEVKREVKVEVKMEEGVGVKVEEEEGERVKREGISIDLPAPADIKREAAPHRPRRIKREVKMEEEQEVRRHRVSIKHEIKREEDTGAEAKLEIKADRERVKRGLKSEPEEVKANIPDMEDILGVQRLPPVRQAGRRRAHA